MLTVLAENQPASFGQFQKKLANLLSKVLDLKQTALVNVVFLSVAQAKSLNWQLRKRRYVPDVLSLNFTSYKKLQRSGAVPFLGELYICWPQVKKQAAQNKKKPEQELAWVYAHGLLHLLGFDHEVGLVGARRMRNLEQKILSQIFKVL